ncbi:Dynein light chain 2, cytoplasmic, partial [Mucuna pruriens]
TTHIVRNSAYGGASCQTRNHSLECVVCSVGVATLALHHFCFCNISQLSYLNTTSPLLRRFHKTNTIKTSTEIEIERERKKMSQDAKKNIAGALTARPNSDERKPLPPAPPAPLKKVIIKSADMIPDMQKEAVDIAVAAFERYNVEKDVAEQIKKEFDKRHGPTWHCIVGRSYVTHETNHFFYSLNLASLMVVAKLTAMGIVLSF